MTFSNKVNWTIEPERCALLVHDMQPHYLRALSSDKRSQIINNARLIGAACASQGIPIFVSQVPPTRQVCERGLMRDMWGKGPSSENPGLDPELGLDGHQIRPLVKRSYSAFYANDFELMLRRLGRNAVLIAGVYTSIGCHYSAVDAFARDIRAFLIADAMADLCETDHDAGLSAAARTCARVVESVEVVQQVDPRYRRGRPESGSFDVC